MAVKKKIENADKTFASVKLYKKDVEELLAIMTTVFGEVRISDTQYEYDSLQELQDRKGTTIKDFKISSPSSSLHFSIGNSTLLKRTGEPEAVNAFAQISTLLNSSKRPILYAIFYPFTFVPLLFVPFIFIYLYRTSIDVKLAQSVYFFGIILVSIPFIMQQVGAFSRLVLADEHQEETFWTRNKDKIIMLLVGGAIGAILTKLIPFILSKIGL